MIGIGVLSKRNYSGFPPPLRSYWQRVAADGGTMFDFNSAISVYRDSTSAILSLSPSAAKAGTLYSVLPSGGAGDFTVTRSTVATRVNKELELEQMAINVPLLSYETEGCCPHLETHAAYTQLITYSNAFGNTYYTKSGATIEGDASTAGSEFITVAADRDFSSNTGFWTLGAGVTISGNALNYASGNVYPGATHTFATGLVGKFVKFEYEITAYTSGALYIYAGGSGSTAFPLTSTLGVHVKYIQVHTTSGDFVINGNAGSFVGSVSNISIKEVSGYPSPSVDYPTDAYKLVATGASGYIQLTTPLTITNATSYANSIYVKRVTGTGNILIKDINNTETVVSGGTDVALGYTRYDVTSTSTSTSGQIGIKLATSGDEVLIFGANLSQTTYAHPYAYTNGATATVTDTNEQVALPTGVTTVTLTDYLGVETVDSSPADPYIIPVGKWSKIIMT